MTRGFDLGTVAYWTPHVAAGVCLAIFFCIIFLVT